MQRHIGFNLAAFAERHKMREDWHGPGEQEVSAIILGDHLDNAHGNTVLAEDPRLTFLKELPQEFVIELRGSGDDTLRINLADLLALAAGQAKEVSQLSWDLDCAKDGLF